MRSLIIFFLLFCCCKTYSQDLTIYKDTIYKFKIGIPDGWRYGKPKSYPDLLLICIRPTTDTTEKIVETFNVSTVRAPNTNLDSCFNRLLRYNSLAGNFAVKGKGSISMNGEEFRWVISTHSNQYNGEMMFNYDFLTYDGEKAYILTMASTSKYFNKYKPLFDKVAKTFEVEYFK